jgi:hypothetical protein
MSNRLVIGTLAIFISAAPTWAEDECPKGTGSGVWAAKHDFYAPPIPPACSRVYTCAQSRPP